MFDEIEVTVDSRNVSVVYRLVHSSSIDLCSFVNVKVKLGEIGWNKDIAMNVEKEGMKGFRSSLCFEVSFTVLQKES